MLIFAGMLGCGGGGGGGTGTGATGATGGGGGGGAAGAGGGSCPASSGSGTLTIVISGTPSGNGLVTAAGQVVTTTTDLPVAAGSYTVTANIVPEVGTTVRTAYTPTVSNDNPCVRAGVVTTVNVVYALIATSGLVWTGVSNAPPATLLGYDPASVATSGNTIAAIAADVGGSDGFTFDPYGNVWVTGGTTTDPPVAAYAAAKFGTDGTKTPDFTLDSPVFATSTPGPKVLTFDRGGDLWVSLVGAGKVVMFTPDQLVTSGTANPTVVESGFTAPYGVAFDLSGNMWVADDGTSTVLRIDAGHLTTSGTGADLTITAMTPSPVFGVLSHPTGLAFDADSNLWVDYDGTIAMIDTSTQALTGTVTITPLTQLVTDVAALPTGIAFDEEEGLWLAYSQGRFARFDVNQLTGSGPALPATIITGSDLGSAGWFAIYPAPAFTPLAHAF